MSNAQHTMNRAYRHSLICGAIPLVTGISIFLLWVATRWSWLVQAGILTIVVGLFIVMFGLLYLARFCYFAFNSSNVPRYQAWLMTLGSLALMISNFFVAVAIIVGVFIVFSAYTVVVINESEQPLTNVRVSGGGCDVAFGSRISPGSSAWRMFWIKHDDGQLLFEANSDRRVYKEAIPEYVTGNLGGHLKITVLPNETIAVEHSTSRL